MVDFESLERKMDELRRNAGETLYERAKLLVNFWGPSGVRPEYSKYIDDGFRAEDNVVGWFKDTQWKPTDIWHMYDRRPNDDRWLTGDIGGINADVSDEITKLNNPAIGKKRRRRRSRGDKGNASVEVVAPHFEAGGVVHLEPMPSEADPVHFDRWDVDDHIDNVAPTLSDKEHVEILLASVTAVKEVFGMPVEAARKAIRTLVQDNDTSGVDQCFKEALSAMPEGRRQAILSSTVTVGAILEEMGRDPESLACVFIEAICSASKQVKDRFKDRLFGDPLMVEEVSDYYGVSLEDAREYHLQRLESLECAPA